MTQHRAEETRSHILDAAGELFAQRGYNATSVADICEQAGVTKGAFYHHFESKQAVFLELRDRWLTPLEAQLTLARNPAENLPQLLQQIGDMARIVFAEAGEDQRQQIFLELLSAARQDPTILPALLMPMHRYREWFAQLISAGIKEGTLRKVDRALAAQVLVSLGFGLVMLSLLDPHGGDWGDIASRAMPLLMQGLEQK
jgi:TetR/AcrR family acrAB operon transcriptional repressor